MSHPEVLPDSGSGWTELPETRFAEAVHFVRLGDTRPIRSHGPALAAGESDAGNVGAAASPIAQIRRGLVLAFSFDNDVKVRGDSGFRCASRPLGADLAIENAAPYWTSSKNSSHRPNHVVG